MHLGGESQLGMCCKVCGRNSPDGKRGAGRIKGLEGGLKCLLLSKWSSGGDGYSDGASGADECV